MARKSGLGREDDFSFKKDKIKQPPKLSQIRESTQASFYIKPDPTLYPKDPCDIIHVSDDLPNLDIIGKPGRQFGETVLYDPVQKVNYLSQSDRYDRSINTYPVGTIERDGKTIYLFCSSQSPTGFWEVTVGGGGTFLEFSNPILTIICPRPFSLQEFTDVLTDGTAANWTQLQGRLTIVSPSSGSGSLNPDIFIIGSRTPTDPPILLLAELEGNPSAFDILVIRTTVADMIDGLSGMENAIAPNTGPNFTIPCSFTPLPGAPNTAFCWVSGTIEITWNPPPDSLWVTEYQLQQNINGTYQTIRVIPRIQERRVTVELGVYYRILAINNVLGAGYSVTESCRFAFAPGQFTFASDRINGLSGSDGRVSTTQYPLAVIRCETPIDEINGLSGSDGRVSTTQYPLAVIRCETPIDEIDGLSGSDGKFLATVYNLVGGIVG
ncbi:hypothetical protein PCC6912_39820 [Chlorogloeopsis fritschii PCC 6912]|uniref:Uncharacterized protein n=1 Tax=Chlorogloeopsis fritschii PCC 6912 TaxID=211165 RepID=A0A433N6B3_CHLFR|nr:hypothetical protein [Chlorogloeopsis fritschii]RUR77023.1 hypothetical protein PCC6912_39820 [Chlorogloeopsis fritschii PCC 6912]